MKLITMRLPAVGLLAALLLAACNLPVTPTPHPTDTPVPPPQAEPTSAQIGGACVTGTWQISNLSEYLQTSLPQMVEGATITLGESSGSLFYSFNADGTTLAGKAEDFKIKATVSTNGVNLPGQITVNGASQGKYQVNNDSGLLTLTDVQPGDLAVTATVAGIPVVSNTPIADLFTFGSSDGVNGSANFECIGNTLKISVDIPNIGPRVVVMERVGE